MAAAGCLGHDLYHLVLAAFGCGGLRIMRPQHILLADLGAVACSDLDGRVGDGFSGGVISNLADFGRGGFGGGS